MQRQRHRASTDDIRRPRQDLQRGHPAGERLLEPGILRPDTVLRPHFRCDRRRNFVAIAVRGHTGRGIDAEMAVIVDNARSHPATCRINGLGTIRGFDIGA